jgi:3-oxo-5-alpha-steroid 4-dehydrogenase 1
VVSRKRADNFPANQYSCGVTVNELTIFNILLICWFVLAVVVFGALFFVAAPYGRHTRSGWGYTVANKTGWVVMEAPASIVFAICFVIGNNTHTATALILLVLWEAHYLHRAFIYPLGRRGTARQMPLVVMSFGFIFNVMNGYLNGRYIFTFAGGYANEWLRDPRFVLGLVLFLVGFAVNRRSDEVLRSLRPPGESGYRISYHRLYRWVSCPNYLGEIIIWIGWAVATWSLPGLVFAFWTVANLMPRARAHHAWYREHFPDYPPERKALVPGLW